MGRSGASVRLRFVPPAPWRELRRRSASLVALFGTGILPEVGR